MSLKTVGIVAIPDAAGSEFDHGAFEPTTRRIFVAHTARDSIEVIDHDAGNHIATLPLESCQRMSLLPSPSKSPVSTIDSLLRP